MRSIPPTPTTHTRRSIVPFYRPARADKRNVQGSFVNGQKDDNTGGQAHFTQRKVNHSPEESSYRIGVWSPVRPFHLVITTKGCEVRGSIYAVVKAFCIHSGHGKLKEWVQVHGIMWYRFCKTNRTPNPLLLRMFYVFLLRGSLRLRRPARVENGSDREFKTFLSLPDHPCCWSCKGPVCVANELIGEREDE